MRKRRRWNIKNKTTNQIAECGMFSCECRSFKLTSGKRIECAYCGTSYPLSGIEEIYNIIPNTLGRYPYRKLIETEDINKILNKIE